MDQVKIGKFIAERRKSANLTQMQLAEKLNITDRAVSKWETGKSMPDSSLMLPLCEVLKITVNDLLSGEVVTVEQYQGKLEENLLNLAEQKQAADRHLLFVEALFGGVCLFVLLAVCLLASYLPMEDWARVVLLLTGFVPILVAVPFLLRIEQKAGYYRCAECGHRYVPKYGSVFMAMHMGRTRYMRCPSCGKRSWQKKRIGKD